MLSAPPVGVTLIAADLSIRAMRFGSTVADFAALSAPFISTLNPATSIPEPSSLLMLGLGVLGVVRRGTRSV